jgi:hypothetical protein
MDVPRIRANPINQIGLRPESCFLSQVKRFRTYPRDDCLDDFQIFKFLFHLLDPPWAHGLSLAGRTR